MTRRWTFPEGARATDAQLAVAAQRRKTWRTSSALLPTILKAACAEKPLAMTHGDDARLA